MTCDDYNLYSLNAPPSGRTAGARQLEHSAESRTAGRRHPWRRRVRRRAGSRLAIRAARRGDRDHGGRDLTPATASRLARGAFGAQRRRSARSLEWRHATTNRTRRYRRCRLVCPTDGRSERDSYSPLARGYTILEQAASWRPSAKLASSQPCEWNETSRRLRLFLEADASPARRPRASTHEARRRPCERSADSRQHQSGPCHPR